MFQYAIEWKTLLERKKARVSIGTKVIFLAAINNQAYAIADKCPHQGVPLSTGKYENGVISCKEHGIEIDMVTGLVANLAKADYLKMDDYDRYVRTYQTKIDNGKVLVDL